MFGKVFVVFQELFVVFADMGHRINPKKDLQNFKQHLQEMEILGTGNRE